MHYVFIVSSCAHTHTYTHTEEIVMSVVRLKSLYRRQGKKEGLYHDETAAAIDKKCIKVTSRHSCRGDIKDGKQVIGLLYYH